MQDLHRISDCTQCVHCLLQYEISDVFLGFLTFRQEKRQIFLTMFAIVTQDWWQEELYTYIYIIRQFS